MSEKTYTQVYSFKSRELRDLFNKRIVKAVLTNSDQLFSEFILGEGLLDISDTEKKLEIFSSEKESSEDEEQLPLPFEKSAYGRIPNCS